MPTVFSINRGWMKFMTTNQPIHMITRIGTTVLVLLADQKPQTSDVGRSCATDLSYSPVTWREESRPTVMR
jgi:hypothetical protein